MSKPNKDGWIRHRGGKCPVEAGQYAEIRLRSGMTVRGNDVHECDWEHYGHGGDIMAWRPHKPDNGIIEFKGVESIPVDSISLEEMERKFEEGPIQWRDRIREIDASAKEEEARHCAAMAEYDKERTSLVAKLKAEGFALIHSDEPNSEVESVQDDIAQQDMSDPANWRAGDMIISLEEEEDISIGGTYHITEIYGNDVIFRDNAGDQRNRCASDYKWHSRPTN